MDWKYEKGVNAGKQHLDVLLEGKGVKVLYDYIKTWSYEKFSQIYMDKDSLIDDKVEVEGTVVREAKRDYLIQHLFKIQDIIFLYKKIVVITGSPRKDGNSFVMTDAFIKAAEEKGYKITRFDATMKKVGGCHACETCFNTGKACSFDDDFNTIARLF